MSTGGLALPDWSPCKCAKVLKSQNIMKNFNFTADVKRLSSTGRRHRHRRRQLPGPGEQHCHPVPRQERQRLGPWNWVKTHSSLCASSILNSIFGMLVMHFNEI